MDPTLDPETLKACWIAEREAEESSDDGPLTVPYQLADPHLLMLHGFHPSATVEVLGQGGDGELGRSQVRCRRMDNVQFPSSGWRT